jgi:hypothetical protein
VDDDVVAIALPAHVAADEVFPRIRQCPGRAVDAARNAYEHTGFSGIGGFVMAQLFGRVRRNMLTDGLPSTLADLAASETLNKNM